MIFNAPDIDYAGLSPVIALTTGIVVVLLAGLFGGERNRFVLNYLTWIVLGATAGLLIWQWGDPKDLVAGSLRLDELAIAVSLIAVGAAIFVTPLNLREPAANLVGHGETQALLLSSVLGMVLLAQSQNLIAFFIALELLSIPLYVLSGSARNRETSLESGLKYLIIGSLGSATLVYGLALIYGGSGSTDFGPIGEAIGDGLADDPLILVGIALALVGLAFKLSIAPFHQWTPDVYEGAPTPVTGFMAVATKAAAFAVFARFFDVALGAAVDDWQPVLAALAVISMAVGNLGGLGQRSLKRLLGYSGIAQAGYMLVGLVVVTELGLSALVFYLAIYALMNLPAFAVIAVRERETPFGDDIRAVEGIGHDRPELAWPLTISMLALIGFPGTAGFMGKLFLIEAAVKGDYTWLGVAIVVGTMISLAYYLPVLAAVWMRPAPDLSDAEMPAMAGGSPEADASPELEVVRGRALAGGPSGGRCALVLGVTVIAAAATVFFGVSPEPLVDWAEAAGASLADVL